MEGNDIAKNFVGMITVIAIVDTIIEEKGFADALDLAH